MVKLNKHDNIVFDEEKDQYDAHLKAYGTDLGAPAIKILDTVNWKRRNINKVNHLLEAKYKDLQEEYDKMMAVFEYNNLIYSTKFSFEPIVGNVYHLYRDKDHKPFLSIISPKECSFDFTGSFKLGSDLVWDKMMDDLSMPDQLRI
ncbi:MAG: hypothetical protein ACI81Y_002043 [Glaciecola sp.]|jgi:hypothetical protein